jgi:hypothetical protein
MPSRGKSDFPDRRRRDESRRGALRAYATSVDLSCQKSRPVQASGADAPSAPDSWSGFPATETIAVTFAIRYANVGMRWYEVSYSHFDFRNGGQRG